MASVVLLVVVMEVLLVPGGRKIGYRGPHAHVHRRRSDSIVDRMTGGHGASAGCFPFFLFLQSADFQ